MKPARIVALFVAISVLALPVAAQDGPAQHFAYHFAPASWDGDSGTLGGDVASPPAANAFLRAATPTPPAEEHKFFDQQQMIGLYAHSAVRLADTIKTCRSISHGGVEDWIPSQSCAGIAAWQAGSVGLALGVGWLFHRTGHHRLERLAPWAATGFSAAGLTKSVFNIR
jgi:hypothetical protein